MQDIRRHHIQPGRSGVRRYLAAGVVGSLLLTFGPAVPALNATWRRIDHCAAPSASTAGAVTTSVAQCPGGRSVELITIAGAGHQWPGSVPDPLAQRLLHVSPPSRALNATQVIWQFFAAHPKPAGHENSNQHGR